MTRSLLHGTLQGDRLHLAAAGAWVSQNAGSLEAQINTAARRHPDVKHVDIDMRAVVRLDTFGAWRLERRTLVCSSHGAATEITGLKPEFHALMEELHAVKAET